MNCLSVFDHFVEEAIKRVNEFKWPFLILIFSNFIWNVHGVWAQNAHTGHQGVTRKIRYLKQ